MNCRDVRDMADSFLSEELLTETNHEILRHLETCPACRAEIDGRRRLRGALRAAFNGASELQPSSEFSGRLRERVREAAVHGKRSWLSGRGWLALAAGVVLAAGVTGATLLHRSPVPSDALAQDAIGDHRNCALKFRLVRMPIPLEEAAQRFDHAFRLLLTMPPDNVSTTGGEVRVTERHSCAYGTRRFGHVIMEYRGRVVSLLMTSDDGAGINESVDAIPHLIGRPVNGLSVVSVTRSHHAILLVSDLDRAELTQLSSAVAVPLAGRLERSVNLEPFSGLTALLLVSKARD